MYLFCFYLYKGTQHKRSAGVDGIGTFNHLFLSCFSQKRKKKKKNIVTVQFRPGFQAFQTRHIQWSPSGWHSVRDVMCGSAPSYLQWVDSIFHKRWWCARNGIKHIYHTLCGPCSWLIGLIWSPPAVNNPTIAFGHVEKQDIFFRRKSIFITWYEHHCTKCKISAVSRKSTKVFPTKKDGRKKILWQTAPKWVDSGLWLVDRNGRFTNHSSFSIGPVFMGQCIMRLRPTQVGKVMCRARSILAESTYLICFESKKVPQSLPKC